MRIISIRNETYERLRKVKNLLKAKSFRETINKLIDIFHEEHKHYSLKPIEETRLPGGEVKKIEETVKKLRTESDSKVVLDTSFIIELLDRRQEDLVYLLTEYIKLLFHG